MYEFVINQMSHLCSLNRTTIIIVKRKTRKESAKKSKQKYENKKETRDVKYKVKQKPKHKKKTEKKRYRKVTFHSQLLFPLEKADSLINVCKLSNQCFLFFHKSYHAGP